MTAAEQTVAAMPNAVLEGGRISFDVEESVYPLEAIYGACYLFLDRCFVFLSRPKPESVTVRLTTRSPGQSATELAGEFANELLSQSLRLRLAQSTARIREYYTAAALRSAGASSNPSIDQLLAELESEDLADDPLEIMVPWEEKHGAAAKKEPGGGDD